MAFILDALDEDDIPKLARPLLFAKDVEQLRELRACIQALPDATKKERMHHALVDFLLEKDERLGMATRVLNAKLIERWVDHNTEKVVKQCPRLFERYAQPTKESIYWLGHHYGNLDEKEKTRILRGESAEYPHAFLHNALKEDPLLWDHLTPIWYGAKTSPLRAAAVELGWKPNATTGYFSRALKARQVHEWGAVMAYPHSTAVVAALLCQDKARLTKQRLANLIGGTAVWAGVEPSRFPLSQANAKDAALAALLVEKTQYPYVLGEFAPKEELDPTDMAFLRGIVDMHIGIGCLELLLKELEQDRLPGETLTPDDQHNDVYALPNLS